MWHTWAKPQASLDLPPVSYTHLDVYKRQVQGSGFNWPSPDHFRLVFLPYEDDLRDAIARIARFLAAYRKRAGTQA